MKEILVSLEEFRLARNIDMSQGYDFVLNKQVGFIVSEISEYLDAENEFDKVDALCDISVFAINAHSLIYHIYEKDIYAYKEATFVIADVMKSSSDILFFNQKYTSVLKHIIRQCFTMLDDMRYDIKKCMIETIKEISARKQDPVQKIEWEENGASGKWQKDKNQDSASIYKANYGICKIA